jgi:hypothetical protein
MKNSKRAIEISIFQNRNFIDVAAAFCTINITKSDTSDSVIQYDAFMLGMIIMLLIKHKVNQ